MERNEGFLKLHSDGSSESASVSTPAHSGIRHLRHLGLGGGGTHALAESDDDSDCCCCGETALRYTFQTLFRSGSNYLACGTDEETQVQGNLYPDPKPTQVSEWQSRN